MTISAAYPLLIPPSVNVAIHPPADTPPGGWAGMLKKVRNCVDAVSETAPQLLTLVNGAAIGCAFVGLGASPLAGVLARAGAVLAVTGTLSGSMAVLAKVYDYLADAVENGASPLLEKITSFSRETLYPLLQRSLDKVNELMNAGAGVVRKLLADCITEQPIIKYLFISFSMPNVFSN